MSKIRGGRCRYVINWSNRKCECVPPNYSWNPFLRNLILISSPSVRKFHPFLFPKDLSNTNVGKGSALWICISALLAELKWKDLRCLGMGACQLYPLPPPIPHQKVRNARPVRRFCGTCCDFPMREGKTCQAGVFTYIVCFCCIFGALNKYV